jgi:hypothetical protein
VNWAHSAFRSQAKAWNPEDFSVDKISGIRILFVPSTELKKELEHIHFERSE